MRYKINAPINDMTADSRQVQAGSLFLAYPGHVSDGRDYIEDAIHNGAAAVMWEQQGFTWSADWQVENLPITDLKQQAGTIASQFYKKPSEQLLSIGVTGTNGKTSVSHWLAQAFALLNRQPVVIGTLGNGGLSDLDEAQTTTPGAIALQKMLSSFVDDGADVLAMEVSSHGLDQGRLNGMSFDVAVLTNVTRDHLDYHKTLKAYQEAKKKLFYWPNLKTAVINHDDTFGRTLENALNRRGQHTLSYGIKSGDVRAAALQLAKNGFSAHIITPVGEAEVTVGLIGEFNVYNVLAVLTTLLAVDVPLEQAINVIAQLQPIAGRMQVMGGGDKPTVVVDYAHTPAALDKVLQTLQTLTKARLICVFGCGGDRDVGKRLKMGKTVSQYANKVIVTNDNPRSEDPSSIVKEIAKGMDGQYTVELDRAQAIHQAIAIAKTNDIVLVAGKGHEHYQEIAGVKHYFSDEEQVKLALAQYEEVAA